MKIKISFFGLMFILVMTSVTCLKSQITTEDQSGSNKVPAYFDEDGKIYRESKIHYSIGPADFESFDSFGNNTLRGSYDQSKGRWIKGNYNNKFVAEINPPQSMLVSLITVQGTDLTMETDLKVTLYQRTFAGVVTSLWSAVSSTHTVDNNIFIFAPPAGITFTRFQIFGSYESYFVEVEAVDPTDPDTSKDWPDDVDELAIRSIIFTADIRL